MGEMSEEATEYLAQILNDLGAVRGQLFGRSQTFVDDQITRFQNYGARIFMSPKQWTWLEDLYVEHVGPLPGGGRPNEPQREDATGQRAAPQSGGQRQPGKATKKQSAQEEQRPVRDDLDDEIPF